ncbi:MAG: hypothetical protein EOO71_25490 [Myxococcaceae bacterium]|nr:MAG: hypothetical protein EOO71_25490 [Myxococcaceae bacterium]
MVLRIRLRKVFAWHEPAREHVLTGTLTFISKSEHVRGFRLHPDGPAPTKRTFSIDPAFKDALAEELKGLKVGDRVRVTYAIDNQDRNKVRDRDRKVDREFARSIQKLPDASTPENSPAA